MTDVTVLVAVYNSERYLPQCLDSLLSQTQKSIQIVCIDDCSTDGSLDVLRRYEQQDARVNVIHLDRNMGQAHARNEGLKIAEGQYIAYLDSDDWLAPDAMESVVSTFRSHPQTDCVLLRMMLRHEEGCEGEDNVFQMPPFDVLNGHDAFALSLNWTIHGCYVARKSLFDRYPYDETCRAYSDDNTTRLHYICSREVRQCDGTYFYRIYPHSVTHSVTLRRFDFLKANESLRRQLQALGVDQSLMRKHETSCWGALVDLYMLYHCHGHQLTADERRTALAMLKHAWQTTDSRLVNRSLKRNFGFIPMPTWPLFRLQEWLYFTLRGLLGKNV